MELMQDIVAQFCYSCNPQAPFSLLCAICLPPTALFMVAPSLHPCSQTSPLSSLHPPSAASDYGDAQSQDRWPSPLQGLKPTMLAQCLHVEQELVVESVHNYFKADTDFHSQTPDNLCLKEKAGKPDVSSYGLEVLCVGLLETCCRPIQRHDAWPGITGVGLQDVFSPWWYNVTYSAARTPGWLSKETPELLVTLNSVLIQSFLFPSEPSSMLRFLKQHFFQVFGKVFWPQDLYVLSYRIVL